LAEESERYPRGYWPERFGTGPGSASGSGSGPTACSKDKDANVVGEGGGDSDADEAGSGKVIASSSIDVDVDTDFIDAADPDVKHDTNAEDSEAARNGENSDSAEPKCEEEPQKLSLREGREMIRVHIGCRVGFDLDAKRTM
jgi:hypothetical protein